jgi:hypothetical protein
MKSSVLGLLAVCLVAVALAAPSIAWGNPGFVAAASGGVNGTTPTGTAAVPAGVQEGDVELLAVSASASIYPSITLPDGGWQPLASAQVSGGSFGNSTTTSWWARAATANEPASYSYRTGLGGKFEIAYSDWSLGVYRGVSLDSSTRA